MHAPVELLDRVAVVAGVAGAIGAAVARRFAAEGARIVLADEDEEALAHIREELRQAAPPVDGLAVDLTSESQIRVLVDRALARFGRIDVLVNTMGTITSLAGKRPNATALVGMPRGDASIGFRGGPLSRARRGQG